MSSPEDIIRAFFALTSDTFSVPSPRRHTLSPFCNELKSMRTRPLTAFAASLRRTPSSFTSLLIISCLFIMSDNFPVKFFYQSSDNPCAADITLSVLHII